VKDLQKGLSISVLVHGFIIAAVFAVWIDKPIHPKSISLDFSILNFEGAGERAGVLTGDRQTRPGAAQKKVNKKEKSGTSEVDQRLRTSVTPSDFSSLQSAPAHGVAGTVSDKDGQVEVSGKVGPSMGDGETGSGTPYSTRIGQSSAGEGYGGSEGRVIRYGSGSADDKTFRHIRDGVMKNVRYPEKARRKGLTGKILLSFMVTEGGSTHDIRVINSSGFSELDDSAKEAIARTRFSQKIPYRLFVILPIEYRLE
jgi:TonB family protein